MKNKSSEPSPGKKFEDALRKVLKTPKSEVDKRIKEDRKTSSARRDKQRRS